MIRTITIGLVCGVGLAACSREKSGARPAASPAPAIKKQAHAAGNQSMDPTIKMINETQLRDCLEHDGVVALVTVDAADIRHAGTRSETVTIKTTVKQTLHGTVGDTLTLQRYTKSGDTVLEVGRMYGVAGGRNPRWAPAFALLDFVEVLPGEENAFVDAQKKAIARLAQKP